MIYEERCVRQYHSHTKKRSNGDLLIRGDFGVWDIFYGKGFRNHNRFRIVYLKRDKTPQLICVSGLHMSHDLREALLKECANG